MRYVCARAHKCTKVQQITRTNNNNGKMTKRTVYTSLHDIRYYFLFHRFQPNYQQFDPNRGTEDGKS